MSWLVSSRIVTNALASLMERYVEQIVLPGIRFGSMMILVVLEAVLAKLLAETGAVIIVQI